MQLLHLRHGGEHRAVQFFQGCWLAATILITGAWDAGSAQPPPSDYSVGIQKLIQLGVPDARQAKYVRTESRGMWAGGDYMGRGPKMTGNAWLLETRTNGTAVVLLNQLNVTELVPTKVMEERMKERLKKLVAEAKPGEAPDEESEEGMEVEEGTLSEMEDGTSYQTGEWKEADLKADIQSLIDYLSKAGGDNDYELKRSAASHFLFAVHVHSRGQSAEASQIISLLFQKIGDSRRVLRAAMSRIADVEYGKVYQQFVKTGDWPRYLSAMEGLLGRFATAWRNGPVVERVAAMVRKQAEQKAAAPVTGEGLTEEDTRVASLLGQTNTVILLHHPVFSGLDWLTSEPAAPDQPSQKAAGPLDLIQQRGGKAIPLLVALLKDEWLVRARGGPSESYFSSDLDDDGMSAEEVEQRMAYFARPVSRGEIARRILEPLVLDREPGRDAENQLTADELAQKSRTWFAQHKTDNRSELMRQLLAEGRQEPLQFLMHSHEAADRAAVESYLMNTNKLAENLESVTQYAQRQGAAAKGFVQQYVAEIKKLPNLVPKRETRYLDAGSLKRRDEQARSEIKALEDLISDRTAEQMLQELTSSEKKWNAQEMYKTGAALTAKLAQEDPAKALTLLLQACLKTKDDQLAEYLVQSASSLRWAEARQPRTAGASPPKPREFKIETHADLWKQVLAQERSNSSPQRSWGGDTLSFKAQVATAIETSYSDPKAFRGAGGMAAAQFLGTKVYEVTVQRAQARLAGKPEAELPAYPDKTKVGKERLAQIGQLVRDSTKETQHEITGRLSLDELLAVPDLVSADPKLNEKLVPGSHLIQNVRLTLTNEALARLCLPLKGKPLDRQSLESLIAECKKLAEQGSHITMTLERRLPLAGVSLNVSANAAGPRGTSGPVSGRARAENQAVLTAMLQSQGPDGVHGYVQWPVKLAAAPKPEARSSTATKPADDDLLPENAAGTAAYRKRQEDEFWTNVAKLFEPARDACQPYTCVLSVQRSNAMEEE